MKSYHAIVLFVFTLLSACGGGGGGTGNGSVKASVNVGDDINADEKTSVKLSAVVSPSGGTVTWSVNQGDSIDGLPEEGESIDLEIPDVKSNSTYTIKADYRAPDGSLVSDTLILQVASLNQVPTVSVTQTGPEELPSKWGDTVVLSAEESEDPDENGQIVSYQWQQTGGVSLTPTSLTDSTLQFEHPLLAASSTVSWQVTVTDDEGGQASNSISIVLAKNDQLVFAKAGNDELITEYETVTLDGSSSQSVSADYRCNWQLVSGPTVTLADANACVTTYTAPDVDAEVAMTWQLTVTDVAGYVGTDTKVVTIAPMKLGYLNDSGQVSCYNATAKIDCTSSNDFAGQDAKTGRDSVVARLAKTGQGDNGFDFTKLDAFADELPNDSTSFSCVRDNVTGLIWEVKEAPVGTLPNVTLRASHNRYTWGFAGVTGSVFGAANSTCESDVNCSLEAYVQAVNATNYCGGVNWRVPTYVELMGLLDFEKRSQNLMIPTQYFPNSPAASLNGNLYYWTKQTSADGTSLSQAYVIDLQTGNDVAYPKANTAYVRLVRTP
ncbi:Lcl C-terminal domain-containing protein [Pseudoalteromonas xiamenensis]